VYQSATVDVPNALNPANPNQSGIGSIYPNPANEYTKIDFILTQESAVSISAYSADGRLVYSSGTTRLPQGEHSKAIDLSNFAKGIYMIMLRVDDRVYYGKLIVD
jgi:hypothetical protein